MLPNDMEHRVKIALDHFMSKPQHLFKPKYLRHHSHRPPWPEFYLQLSSSSI
jgi:hypothetical protein